MADTFDYDEIFELDIEEIQIANKVDYFPAGKYKFKVDEMFKENYNGGEKLPACPMAKVRMTFYNEDKITTVWDRFYLCESMKNKIGRFFFSIGSVNKDKAVIDWSKVEGAEGIATVEIHEWNGEQHNKVKYYEKPEYGTIIAEEPEDLPF